MPKPNINIVLEARNAQLMGYAFMTLEQQEKAEKEWAIVKKEYGL